jgi:hypothetical protein
VDGPNPRYNAPLQYLLDAFLLLNVLHLLAVLGLSRLERKQRRSLSRRRNSLLPDVLQPASRKGSQTLEDNEWDHEHDVDQSTSTSDRQYTRLDSRVELSVHEAPARYVLPPSADISEQVFDDSPTARWRTRRGEFFAGLCLVAILFAWALFLGTAWFRLRSKEERGGSANVTSS